MINSSLSAAVELHVISIENGFGGDAQTPIISCINWQSFSGDLEHLMDILHQ